MALLSTSAIRRAYGTPRGSPQVIRSRLPDGPRWSAGDALLARRGAVGRLVDDLRYERQDAMAHLLAEGDLRGRAHDARDLEDAAEDVLEVGVGARHHAAVQVAG